MKHFKRASLLYTSVLAFLLCVAGRPQAAYAKTDPQSLFDAGVTFATENNIKKAEKNFKKVISDEPDNYASHFNLGLLYFRDSKYDLSLKYSQRASDLNPFDARANKLLASVQTMLDNPQESKKILATITAKDRTDIDSHKKLGIIYLRENNIQAALGEFTLTKNLSPSDLNNNLLLAAADTLNNDPEKALTRVQSLKSQLNDAASLAFY